MSTEPEPPEPSRVGGPMKAAIIAIAVIEAIAMIPLILHFADR